MARTKAERAEIARQNGSKSRGPVHENTKRKVSFNALASGYYSVVAQPVGVDQSTFLTLKHDWINYYHPQSPAAFALIDRCVRATINHDRSEVALETILADQRDEVGARLQRRRGKQVAGHVQWLPTQPAKAAAALRATGLGCRTVIAKLEAIGDLVDRVGYLYPPELHALLNLVGVSEHDEILSEVPFCIRLFNSHALPRDAEGEVAREVARLTRPECRPAVFQNKDLSFPVMTRELAQDRLRTLVDDQIASVLALEKELQGKEAIERARVLEPCNLIQDPAEARTYFRQQADTRSTFHRAYRDLLLTLERDSAAAGDEPDHGCEEGPAPAATAGEGDFGIEPSVTPEVIDSQEPGTSVMDTGSLTDPPPQGGSSPASPGAAEKAPAEAGPAAWGTDDPRRIEVPGAGVSREVTWTTLGTVGDT